MKPIKIWPKITKWEHWNDSACLHVMIFLLTEAKQKKSSFRGEVVERGEVAAGYGCVANGTGLSDGVTRGAMKRMVKSGDLSYRVFRPVGGVPFSIIRITNFEEYQKDQPLPPRKDLTPYMTAQRVLMNRPFSDDFSTWWNLYRKGVKRTAWSAWQKSASIPPIEKMLEVTQNYIDYCKSINRPMMDGQGWINQCYHENTWTHDAQGTEQEEGDTYDVKFG